MGLLGLGASYKQNATAGFRDLAGMETNRNMTNDTNRANYDTVVYQNKIAQRGQDISAVATIGGFLLAGLL